MNPFKFNDSNGFQKDNQRGTGILEFALVLPILGLFIFGSLEVSRVVMANELAASVSREAANAAYRECPSTGTTVTSCLQDIAQKLQGSLRQALDNQEAVVAIQVFSGNFGVGGNHFNSATDRDLLLDQKVSLLQYSASQLQAKTTVDGTNGAERIISRGLQQLVVGEVFYVYRPASGLIPGFSEKVFHEATIY